MRWLAGCKKTFRTTLWSIGLSSLLLLTASRARSDESPFEMGMNPNSERLYHSLVLEFASAQGDTHVAEAHRRALIEFVEDPEFVIRALVDAIGMQDRITAEQAALRWSLLEPNNTEPLLALMALQLDDEKASRAWLLQAAEVDPESLDQAVLALYIAFNKEQRQRFHQMTLKIIQDLNKEVRIGNASRAALFLLGAQNAAFDNRLREAEAFLQESLNIAPEQAHALILKAKLIKAQTQSEDKALAFLKETLEQHPRLTELKIFYAMALADQKQWAMAIPLLESATSDPVYSKEAWWALADLYERKGSLSDALNALQQMSRLLSSPRMLSREEQSLVQFKMATLYEKTRQWEASEVACGAVPEGTAHWFAAQIKRGQLMARANRVEAALVLLEGLTPQTTEEFKAMALLKIDLLWMKQEYKQMDKLLNYWLAYGPDDLDFLFARALLRQAQGRSEEAESDMRLVWASAPGNKDIGMLLGQLLWENGKADEAQRVLESLKNFYPKDQAVEDALTRYESY